MIKIIKILLTFSVLVILLATVVVTAYLLAYREKVFPGVYYQNQHLGNWTKNEVENFIENKNERLAKGYIIFKYQDKVWKKTFQELHLKLDGVKIAEKAFFMGRNGMIPENLKFRLRIFWSFQQVETNEDWDMRGTTMFLKSVAQEINLAPVEGLFEFTEGRVKAFKPAKNGRNLDISQTLYLISQKEMTYPKEIIINLPVNTIKPKVSMDQADNLGIIELIGKGESYFKDSIPVRIYNISLGSSKFHGLLIKPGDTFSFNQNIGKVSTFSGYQQAYVIEKGKTVLGDGGGVCQVSTTLYRAALYAGLPIVERVAHAYRVGYYEPPVGLDATVYEPSPDFRFKNDTGKYILIQTIYQEGLQKLTFEFYGTNDGRISEISEPVIVSTSPPPEPKYQDDPTLPKGTEKQIDTAHSGAKVYFTRKVTKNGLLVINETVWSNYIPWAAVILRGTKE